MWSEEDMATYKTNEVYLVHSLGDSRIQHIGFVLAKTPVADGRWWTAMVRVCVRARKQRKEGWGQAYSFYNKPLERTTKEFHGNYLPRACPFPRAHPVAPPPKDSTTSQ
jgi:hypothetical protein